MLKKFQASGPEVLNGTLSIELTGDGGIAKAEDVEAYRNGNKDLYNDFTAAKDALDLDHSELWWLDSGYLSFRLTHDGSGYHISIGPGRAANYLLAGQEISHTDTTHTAPVSVAEMQKEVDAVINEIVDTAVKEANAADNGDYSEVDKKAAVVRSVHDQIVRKISYRYETECDTTKSNDSAKYIRTLYALVSHEGVCESYARAMQVCLTKLGIECVLIHGIQTKGTPEDHMWNAVNIPENGMDHWYAIDATWDDPLTADWYGKRDLTWTGGKDGKENSTYLLVGQSTIGEYWHPSGYVSMGGFEFKYPTIETAGFNGDTAFQSANGLEVKYSAGTGSMEDGLPAGVFTVTFQGMNLTAAAEKGFYFMLKMYDYHSDGTFDVMDEWYYAAASLAVIGSNKYFYDSSDGLRVYTGTCEYVDVAVTTCKPTHYDQWSTNFGSYWEEGYFQGTESDIVAQSGMLYNTNSSYEAPPYVQTQFPAANGNATAGYDYRFKVTYDDYLYHILPDRSAADGISAIASDDFVNNYEQAQNQTVQVRYTTNQQDLHNNGAIKIHQVAGDLPFDKDRDGFVDMDDDFKWIYASDTTDKDGKPVTCPNAANHQNGKCDVNIGCPIVGVEFDFRASDQWIDDVTEYDFSIEGVVGSRSSKFPNHFSIIATVPGLCPACYRSQGIDWNLWGQPTLLDAPENLNLHEMAVAGGTDPDTLAKLDAEMNKDDLNGRLMLVVENKSQGAGNREDYEEIDDYLEKHGEVDGNIISSSVFEINFNRICPMVKLKPNQGQSLRVQVGYPAGVTYESLGKGNVELKAYHFTRCDPANEKDHPCPNSKKDGHKWGDDIVDVNEITIIPTPYGMVIMCDSFSPFEIVAVEKSGASAADGRTLVVVSDENGTVSVDGHDAVGKDGNITFTDGTSKSFTVEPKTGFAVDTVSLGGTEIEVANNKFTLTGDQVQHSDVLSVTFLPEEIKAEEEEQGITSVVASVCTHTTTEISNAGYAASCTEAGKTDELKCTKCGQIVQHQTDIPATGHTIKTTQEAVKPTCTTAGHRAVSTCEKCDEVISDGAVIPATSHLFMNYTLVEATCLGEKKKATCENCTAVDERTFPVGAVDHEYYKDYEESKPATCTENAIEIDTCKWCGDKVTREIPGTKTAHQPNEKGICEVCQEFVCGVEGHKLVDDEAVPVSCTENGKTAGQHCEVCGLVTEAQEVIPALGHDFGDSHTKGSKCSRCNYVLTQDEHTSVPIDESEATCTTQGSKGGFKCSICGDIIEQPTISAPLGHKWPEVTAADGIVWNWSTDSQHSASVTLTCSRDGCDHEETFAAAVTSQVTTDPTCTAAGVASYTATFTVDGKTYTNTVTGEAIPRLEHEVTDWKSNGDATCTKHDTETGTCTLCGEKLTRTGTEMLPHSFASEVTLPTCTAAGYTTDTCTVCEHSEKRTGSDVAALGHNYVDGVCTRCNAADPGYTPSQPSTPSTPSTGGSGGSSSSTVTNPDGSTTTTTTRPDGSASSTTTTKDGVVGRTETSAGGAVTSAEVIIPSTAKGTVTAPIEVEAAQTSKAAPRINVRVQGGGTARVEIPVSHVRPGDVAVIVHADGTEEIVRDSAVTGNGVALKVENGATVKIVDNGKTFADVQAKHHWASDAVEFVSARELFNGTGDNQFSPEGSMTRGMLVTVLYRLTYEPDAAAASFRDVPADAYYADAVAWAKENHVVDGYPGGIFAPEEGVSREQMVTILYRYAKDKGYTSGGSAAALTGFVDAGKVGDYAAEAMRWAVGAGLLTGVDATHLAPQDGATRAQIATIFMRFCDHVIK